MDSHEVETIARSSVEAEESLRADNMNAHQLKIPTIFRQPPKPTSNYVEGNFRELLYKYTDHPEAHESTVFCANDEMVVIYDCYPKGRVHLLVMPRRGFLDVRGCVELTADHYVRLKRLHDVAEELIRHPTLQEQALSHIASHGCVSECITGTKRPRSHGSSSGEASASTSALTPDSEAASAEEIERVPACDPHSLFMVGYHSVPSLYPLHLHIVSRDLQSSALKNKKHWNSFTTPFFLAAAKVEGWLRDGLTARSQMQSYPMRYEALLKEPMLCNRCGALLKNMPHLKQHQDTCLSNPKYT